MQCCTDWGLDRTRTIPELLISNQIFLHESMGWVTVTRLLRTVVLLYIPAILINFKNSGPVPGHSESPRCQTRLTFLFASFISKCYLPYHMTLSLWPLCLPSTKKNIFSVDIDIYCDALSIPQQPHAMSQELNTTVEDWPVLNPCTPQLH